MLQHAIADGPCIARQEIDDSGRQSRRFEQFEDLIVAVNSRAGGFPDDGIAHQRGSGRQVRSDRCEIERRDGVHEAFERPVIQPVPHAERVSRLVAVDFLGKGNIESQEVDRFTDGVDLRLMRRLALIEHR